jgi:hypothetical protein
MVVGEHVTLAVHDDSRAATAARPHLHNAGQDLAGGGFGGARRGTAVGRRPLLNDRRAGGLRAAVQGHYGAGAGCPTGENGRREHRREARPRSTPQGRRR